MKKICLIFIAVFFANVMSGQGAYFYADDLESAISSTFPENLQSVVANEYAAQMNPTTGEIDENGIYNVCYAGGFDVSTASGAENCNNFVGQLQREYTDPYSGPYNCNLETYQSVSANCNYTKGASLQYYTNPGTRRQKIQKCIFDAIIDWAIDNHEGKFQQRERDTGNRICKNMKPLDEDGNIWNQNSGKKMQLGATKFGITTCSTGLSVECVCVMSRDQAKHFYWTRYFYNLGYYKLPYEISVAVLQLSIGGAGKVMKELKSVINLPGTCETDIVVTQCVVDAVNAYLETHTVDDFYRDMAKKRDTSRSRQMYEILNSEKYTNCFNRTE